MTALFEELKERPDLALFHDEVGVLLRGESELRHQFYAEITPDRKAEFINGEAIDHSPVTVGHNLDGGNLFCLLSAFVRRHQAGAVFIEKVMISLTRNDYEPDIVYFGPEKAARFQRKDRRLPAPDFIVEILSERTENRDRGVKFRDYAAHGVREYWLVDPRSEFVEQYDLVAGGYELRSKSGTGLIRGIAVPGFEIPIRAIFDPTENLAAVREILSE